MSAKAIELPPATILDCTPDEYKTDPCETPSLSASCAHTLVSKSPLHAWTSHPKFGQSEADEEDEEALKSGDRHTKATVNGTIVHSLILGKGADLVVVDAENFKTQYAREQRDAAKEAGKVPVCLPQYERLKSVVDILRENCAALGYEFTGQSEIPIQWYDRGQRGPVLCRSMIDHGWLDDGVTIDVKTIRSANPEMIARHFVDYGYAVQDCAYARAVERLRPALEGRVDMTFLFMEIEPPYAVVPVVPDGPAIEIGRQHWNRAVAVWEECLSTGRWPSYCSSRIVIETPQYLISRHLGKEWTA